MQRKCGPYESKTGRRRRNKRELLKKERDGLKKKDDNFFRTSKLNGLTSRASK